MAGLHRPADSSVVGVKLKMSERKQQTVCITRHGDRLDFADPEWFKTAARPYDPPLSPDGIVQARELGRRLLDEDIRQIFSSPFLRCVQTAQEVAEILGLSFELETGLSEWLNPQWFSARPELEPVGELARRYRCLDPAHTSRVAATYPETGEGALRRAARTASLLTEEIGENLLFVGHGASVLGATAGLLGKSPAEAGGEALLPPIQCCCLVKLVRTNSRPWVLELAVDTSHLSRTEGRVRFA